MDGAGRELSLGGVLLVLAPTLALGVWGLLTSGGMVGLLSALGGALGGFAALFSARAVRLHRRLRDPPAPSVHELAPEQALAVLSAVIGGAGRAPALSSELLTASRELEARADADLRGAIVEAEALLRRHPRSPAAAATLARLHRRAGASEAAARMTSTAIGLAVDGGMNGAAVAIYQELEPLRDDLQLDARRWEALARALAARDLTNAAGWCRARAALEKTGEAD